MDVTGVSHVLLLPTHGIRTPDGRRSAAIERRADRTGELVADEAAEG
jgi:hypothetical protein